MRHFAIAVLALVATACTSAKIEIVDGDKTIKAEYVDLHPGGNAVDLKAVWEGIGNLEVDRQTEDSDTVVNAISEAVETLANPIPL